MIFRLGEPHRRGALDIATGVADDDLRLRAGRDHQPFGGPDDPTRRDQNLGFKPLKNVRAYYYMNQSSKSKICRARALGDRRLLLCGACAAELNAGPPGVHIIRIKGPRWVDYSTTFVSRR